jgi:hypothetical protein
MTYQVEKLFNRINTLPEELQENLVFFWSDDIENELNFDNRISETSDKLIILAQKALDEFSQSRTYEKGFDEL